MQASVTASEYSTQEPLGELLAALSEEWPLNGQTEMANARLKLMTCLLRMHCISMLPFTLLNKLLYKVVTLIPKKSISGKFFPLTKAEEYIQKL